MFGKFYVTKNQKISKDQAAAEAREEISTYLKSLEF
jgi:hypothetical protein